MIQVIAALRHLAAVTVPTVPDPDLQRTMFTDIGRLLGSPAVAMAQLRRLPPLHAVDWMMHAQTTVQRHLDLALQRIPVEHPAAIGLRTAYGTIAERVRAQMPVSFADASRVSEPTPMMAHALVGDTPSLRLDH